MNIILNWSHVISTYKRIPITNRNKDYIHDNFRLDITNFIL
jgi:hypothetical protein